MFKGGLIINKYIKISLILIFIFLFIKIDVCYASISENINFNNITIEDGLSQSTVETIFQDSRGYIWIGTNDGLNRYNGYEFKQYKYDKYDKNSIAKTPMSMVSFMQQNNLIKIGSANEYAKRHKAILKK